MNVTRLVPLLLLSSLLLACASPKAAQQQDSDPEPQATGAPEPRSGDNEETPRAKASPVTPAADEAEPRVWRPEPPAQSNNLQPLYQRGAEKIRAAALSLSGTHEAIEVERPFNRTRLRIDPVSVRGTIVKVLVEESRLTVAEGGSPPWVLQITIDGESVSDGTSRVETHTLTLKLVERASRRVLAEAKVRSGK